jgi:hypothetical protein
MPESRDTIRMRLKPDEAQLVYEYRGSKVNHTALNKECEEQGIPVENVNYYWFKSEKFSINVKGNSLSVQEMMDEFLNSIKEYAPMYPTINYEPSSDGHLFVIDPADIHIGKLSSIVESGDEYNHDIAVKRVKEGVIGLVSKCNFNIDRILFIVGNDILHVDNAKNATTAGTHQDTSAMWFDNFKTAQRLLTDCIEILIQIAPVHVQYDPSNHDYTNGFFLAQTIEAWFRNCESVTFNVSIAHRKYFVYGANIIGTTHGDGAKEADLPLLMAHEASESWGECKHRYFYIHHIHHKKSKDYMSVNVEALRSPSGTDSWHHRNGYQHSPKAVEGFVHHPVHGQVARLTHIF